MSSRLMIVDDQPFVRDGLRMLLATIAGYEVVGEACNGSEAVRVASELRPDIVLMNVAMPEANGIVAARYIMGGAGRRQDHCTVRSRQSPVQRT